jgi:hypothetical protein
MQSGHVRSKEWQINIDLWRMMEIVSETGIPNFLKHWSLILIATLSAEGSGHIKKGRYT